MPAIQQQPRWNSDVVNVGIQAVALDYDGPCPVVVRFQATIYLDRTPMKVQYYWERSDGSKTRPKSVELSANIAPKLNVKDEWVVGVPGKSYRATDRLHVKTDAGEVLSDTATSPGRCRR